MRGRFAILPVLQVKPQILDIAEMLVPALERLKTYGANARVPLAAKFSYQRTAYEAIRTGHYYKFTLLAHLFLLPGFE